MAYPKPDSGGDRLRKWLPHEALQRLDRELYRLARGEAALRLVYGEALETFAAKGMHHRLGFSSLDAYVKERCNTSGRWAGDSPHVGGRMTLSRRAKALPRIEKAIYSGNVGFEAAVLVGRVATQDTVDGWIERAGERTFKHLQQEVNAVEMLGRIFDLNKDVLLPPAEE